MSYLFVCLLIQQAFEKFFLASHSNRASLPLMYANASSSHENPGRKKILIMHVSFLLLADMLEQSLDRVFALL